MATGSNTKKPCCKCNKGGATFTCDGCHQSFCLKHTSDHRQELSQQMDNIGQECDILKRDIYHQNVNNSLLAEIDRWEEVYIAKIRSSAENARIDLKRLEEESKFRLNSLMKKLSNELRSNRETDEYTEDNLIRWINHLKELRQELEKLSEIEIEEDKSLTFSLIKMKKTNIDRENAIDLSSQNMASNAEKFIQKTGPVILSEDGRSAICTVSYKKIRDLSSYSSVYGCLRYSYGIYNLRFRLNTSHSSSLFFGILTSSQPIFSEPSVLEPVYGYWSRGKHVRAASRDHFCKNIVTRPNDIVLFILDCSSSKTIYIHERTQLRDEIIVDQKICPFPWKLVVTLCQHKDEIEILNS